MIYRPSRAASAATDNVPLSFVFGWPGSPRYDQYGVQVTVSDWLTRICIFVYLIIVLH
jgi:hypothetical protein